MTRKIPQEIPIKGLSNELQIMVYLFQEYKKGNIEIVADQIYKKFPPIGRIHYNLAKLTALEFLKKRVLQGTSQKLGQPKVIYSLNPDRLPGIEQYLIENLEPLKPLFLELFTNSKLEDLRFELKSYLEDSKIKVSSEQVKELYNKLFNFLSD